MPRWTPAGGSRTALGKSERIANDSHLRSSRAMRRLLIDSARRAAAACVVLGAFGPSISPAAPATEPVAIRLELNRLEPREGGACRVWLVLNNGAEDALDPLRLDLVLFGRDGVVARRLAVNVGPLPGGRRVVRIFEVAGQPCEGIGEVLLNDVLACGEADRSGCIDRATLASRVDVVAFVK